MKMTNVIIDGIEYAPVVRATGTRAVVVVDRGWIFAGDVTREGNRIFLDNAVWVFRWESIGFDGVIANPKDKNVTIRKMKNRVEIPVQSEIFSVPVSDDWGV
jgi:hypothetical protein